MRLLTLWNQTFEILVLLPTSARFSLCNGSSSFANTKASLSSARFSLCSGSSSLVDTKTSWAPQLPVFPKGFDTHGQLNSIANWEPLFANQHDFSIQQDTWTDEEIKMYWRDKITNEKMRANFDATILHELRTENDCSYFTT